MSRYTDTLEKAMQCIHLARAINDRYPDPAKMPAEELQNRKSLLAEAARLQDIAETEKAQANLETWASAPDTDAPALAGAAYKAAAAGSRDGDRFAEASHDLSVRRFAKALRGQSLGAEEKAAIVEDNTGQIIVPADIAGPIFLSLPRTGVLRNLATVRSTTSNRIDVRSLTGVTGGWGQIELTGTAGLTDAGIAPSGPTTVSVHDLVALVQIGVDELADTDANLVALVQEIVGRKFAEMEDDAFAAGSGTSRPWGLGTRAATTAIPASQGVTAAASAITPDNLRSMQYLIASNFANNGVYLASDDATQAIALLKDTTSNYLWQPSVQAGEPDRLFGRPFYRVSGLPAMTAATGFTNPAVLFGDINAAYLVAQREQVSVQRLDERYADQGLVGFLFRHRVGGDVIRPGAVAKYLL